MSLFYFIFGIFWFTKKGMDYFLHLRRIIDYSETPNKASQGNDERVYLNYQNIIRISQSYFSNFDLNMIHTTVHSQKRASCNKSVDIL